MKSRWEVPQLYALDDIALVMTQEEYRDYARTNGGVILKKKIFLPRIVHRNKPTCYQESVSEREYVVIPNSCQLSYISLFLNSTYGKVKLPPKSGSSEMRGPISIKRLKEFKLPLNEKFMPYCCDLEDLICWLSVQKEIGSFDRKDIVEPILMFIEELREGVVMELLMPWLFEMNQFSVIKAWADTVTKYDIKCDQESTVRLFDTLCERGNELMEGMNNLRVMTDNIAERLS